MSIRSLIPTFSAFKSDLSRFYKWEADTVESDYSLSPSASNNLVKLFSDLYVSRDTTFGNGRLARNVYEKTINNHANRINSEPLIDYYMLSTIEEIDLPSMADLHHFM